MWEVVLSHLKCVTATSAGGDDELVALFHVRGAHAGAATVTAFSVEDCQREFRIVSGRSLGADVVTVSSEGFPRKAGPDDSPSGFIISALPPRLPVRVITFGLEVDGSDSAETHARDYWSALSTTGRIDATIGRNDNVLWNATWDLRDSPPGRGANNSVEMSEIGRLSPSPDIDQEEFLETTFVDTINRWNPGVVRHMSRDVKAVNSDQCSEYHFTIDFVWRGPPEDAPNNLRG